MVKETWEACWEEKNAAQICLGLNNIGILYWNCVSTKQRGPTLESLMEVLGKVIDFIPDYREGDTVKVATLSSSDKGRIPHKMAMINDIPQIWLLFVS